MLSSKWTRAALKEVGKYSQVRKISDCFNDDYPLRLSLEVGRTSLIGKVIRRCRFSVEVAYCRNWGMDD